MDGIGSIQITFASHFRRRQKRWGGEGRGWGHRQKQSLHWSQRCASLIAFMAMGMFSIHQDALPLLDVSDYSNGSQLSSVNSWTSMNWFSSILNIQYIQSLNNDILYFQNGANPQTFGLPQASCFSEWLLHFTMNMLKDCAVSVKQDKNKCHYFSSKFLLFSSHSFLLQNQRSYFNLCVWSSSQGVLWNGQSILGFLSRFLIYCQFQNKREDTPFAHIAVLQLQFVVKLDFKTINILKIPSLCYKWNVLFWSRSFFSSNRSVFFISPQSIPLHKQYITFVIFPSSPPWFPPPPRWPQCWFNPPKQAFHTLVIPQHSIIIFLFIFFFGRFIFYIIFISLRIGTANKFLSST